MDPVEVNYLWDNHLVFSFDARARVRRTMLYRSDGPGETVNVHADHVKEFDQANGPPPQTKAAPKAAPKKR